MTKKRFWYDFEDCNGAKIVDFKKDKEYPLETIGDFRDIEDLLNSLNDENEQLKQTMKEVAELLEEEVDLFSDKATEHDINAYVEIKKFDNKDAYYMATSTKKAIKMLKELKSND